MPSFDPKALRTRLSRSHAELTDGLTDQEFHGVESRFGFRFGTDHSELLTCALPIGQGWPDWRHGSEEQLRSMLDWPVEGILFDVENNAFWPPSWGPRSAVPAEALAFAAVRLGQVPA